MSTKNTKNITINGVKYKFDVAKAISDGYLKPERIRRIGQIYRDRYTDDLMLLCQCDTQANNNILVLLVSLDDGVRWTDPVEVKNRYDISDDEWTEISGGDPTIEWAADSFGDLFVQR